MQTNEELRNIESFRTIIDRIINDGNTDLCERYLHPDMAIRRYGLTSLSALLIPNPPPPAADAIAGFKAGLAQIRAAFPDWSHTIDHVVAKDDWVSGTWTLNCTHLGTFMGLPPTQRSVKMNEAGFMRFVDGRMVEGWFIGDELGMARQLGVECSVPKD
ncbi:ester cyclase [Paraburkholderia sp. IMGN_8]|uniref:ester cyclase n=1 Tax=Paraburkholderia sp. IMGN_8 TaxID=3136564 RepID=UPI0031019C92